MEVQEGNYLETHPVDKDRIIRDEWMAGTSITAIGTMVGCSRSAVSRAAQRLNLPARLDLPTRETMPDADLDTLRSEWALGTSVSAIAAKLNCTIGSVLRRVKKYDLPARPSPILRDVTPKPRDIDRHSPGYVAPGRVAPSFKRFIQKAPQRSLPSASAPAPTPDRPPNEPGAVGVGALHPCQRVISADPELRLCGFSCYTPPGHGETSEFCVYHFHFRGRP